MKIQPSVINIYRRPLEVAESLRVRHGLSLEHSILFWLRNQLDAEFYTRGCIRTCLSFDELLEDWHTALKRVETELQITFPDQQAFQDKSVELFLDPWLKHHDQTTTSGKESHLLEFADQTYQSFVRLRTNPLESSTQEELNKKRAVLKSLRLEGAQNTL